MERLIIDCFILLVRALKFTAEGNLCVDFYMINEQIMAVRYRIKTRFLIVPRKTPR